MTISYSSKDIKTLSDIESVQVNPDQYIGSTETPTHLIEEALDNALDEAQTGNVSIIAINIDTKNHIYSIMDNGRGIPLTDDVPKLISTKLHSGAKFRGSKTAYEISCLVGSTKFMLLDGTEPTIEEMAEKSEKEYWGLSSTVDGKWEATKLIKPRITGYTKKIVRVYIDNGYYEECTPDHLWLMRDGSYKKAIDLVNGDSLMPCYSKVNESGYKMIRPNNTYDYIRNIKFENRNFRPLYRIVYESVFGKIPFGFAVHHIDTNTLNDCPENLKLLDNKLEHLPEHARINSENGTVYVESLIKYNKSEKGRNKSRENGLKYGKHNLNEYVNSDKNRKDKRKFMKRYNNLPGKQHELQSFKCLKYAKTLLLNYLPIDESTWELFRPYGIPKFNTVLDKYFNLNDLLLKAVDYEYSYDTLTETKGNKNIVRRMVSIIKRVDKNGLPLSKENYNNERGKFCPTIDSIEKYFDTFENFISYYQSNNHNISKIEVINLDDAIPVYDVTSIKNSNFVLSSGVVVHNSGLHGVGLVTLAALSDFYTVEIYRDEQYGKWEFEGSKFKRKKIVPFIDKKPFSTKIQFKPSYKYFESLIPNINRIKRRLTIASAELSQNISFILNIDGNQEILKLSLMDYFKGACITPGDEYSKVMYFKTSNPPEEFNVILTYSKTGSVTPRSLSSVNLLPVDDGGTHINVLYEILRDLFVEKAKKLEYTFQPSDTLVGLRAYLMLSLKEPRFGGQTKSKLTSRKSGFDGFASNLKKQLEIYFTKHHDHLEELLNQFQEYRHKLDAKKIKPKTGARASTKFTKLRDCTSKMGELFIAEGQSASGGLVECRNPRTHAILPLKGKIPSAATKKEILKNKEISELIMALGTGWGPNFDLSGLKYSKIICATDADEDGLHIFCLLTLALAILVPDVIKAGRYFYAQTPLYAINEKNNFIPLWTEEEISKAKTERRKLIRAKGLGELNPDQLKKVLIDDTRKLIPITYTSNLSKIVKLFTDSDEKRKLLKGEWKI